MRQALLGHYCQAAMSHQCYQPMRKASTALITTGGSLGGSRAGLSKPAQAKP